MKPIDSQVLYLGRWVSREHFRTYVYNKTDKKMVNSYPEFCDMIASGLWFAENPGNDDEKQEKVVQIKRGRKCRSQVKV